MKEKVYINCPICGKKLFRITTESSFKKIYIWCKNCKKEICIDEPMSRK